jgi:hypothetical protein
VYAHNGDLKAQNGGLKGFNTLEAADFHNFEKEKLRFGSTIK